MTKFLSTLQSMANVARLNIANTWTALQTFSAGILVTAGDLKINNNQKLYLDGGSNTYLIEDTGDTIDTYCGGTFVYRTAAVGIQLISGKKLYLDGGGDTYIFEQAPNFVQHYVGGTSRLDLATTYANFFTDVIVQPTTGKIRLDGNASGDTYITESSANTIQTYANGVRGMQIYGSGTEANVSIGAPNILSTTATFGFLQIPTTLGTPTGVPNAVTGKTSICFDQTNLKLMCYVSGVGWRTIGTV
jgi:hypothetical protein